MSEWLTHERVEIILGKRISPKIAMVLTSDDRLFFRDGTVWIEAEVQDPGDDPHGGNPDQPYLPQPV